MDWNTAWNNSAKKRAAIRSINPSVRFHWSEDIIKWADDNTETIPTEAEIDSEIIRLDAEYTALAYSRARALAYPSIKDQLDAIWKGGDDTIAMKIIIDKVKSLNPKGE